MKRMRESDSKKFYVFAFDEQFFLDEFKINIAQRDSKIGKLRYPLVFLN
jgi:hypothetical protein